MRATNTIDYAKARYSANYELAAIYERGEGVEKTTLMHSENSNFSAIPLSSNAQ